MIHLTSKERKSLLFVAVVLVLATIFQYLLPHRVKSDQYDYTLQDSLFRVFSADTVQQPPTERQAEQGVKKTRKSRIGSNKLPSEKSININTAKSAELQKLPGIGPKTAQNILDYRETSGPFLKLEQLTKVKRIGPKTLQKISPFIYIKADSDTSVGPDKVK